MSLLTLKILALQLQLLATMGKYPKTQLKIPSCYLMKYVGGPAVKSMKKSIGKVQIPAAKGMIPFLPSTFQV